MWNWLLNCVSLSKNIIVFERKEFLIFNIIINQSKCVPCDYLKNVRCDRSLLYYFLESSIFIFPILHFFFTCMLCISLITIRDVKIHLRTSWISDNTMTLNYEDENFMSSCIREWLVGQSEKCLVIFFFK